MPRPNPRTIAEYRKISSIISDSFDAADRKRLLGEIAEKARWDLHFFAVVVMGCTVMSPTVGIHGRVCSFLQSAEPARKWLEMFRGGMKSTLGTVAWNVQAVLRNPEEHRLIVSATHPLAKSFLRDIKRVVTSKVFRAVYPQFRPVKDQWNQTEAALEVIGEKRTSREPTWGTAGIDVGITGTHWTAITWDDLVIPENVESREMAERVETKFKQLRPLLDTWNTPELICSTPYENYDMYEWLKRSKRGWFKRLSIPVLDGEGQPAWAEEFPHPRIEELRQLDLKMFHSQYMLDPRPVGLRVFKSDTMRYWRRPEEQEGPGWSEAPPAQRPVVMRLEDLSLFMGWDPSTGSSGGDESAMAVVGVDAFGNFYVVDVVHGLYSESEQMDLFFMLQEHYARYGGIQRTALEQAAGFKSYGESLEAEMRTRDKWHWVEPAQLHNQNKTARVRNTLGPKYQMGRIFHHHTLYRGEVEQQLLEFPGRHDDMCDALSHAVDFAQQYGGYGAPTEEKAKVQALSTFGMHPRIGLTLEQIQSGEYSEELGMLRKGVGVVGLFG